MTGAERRAARVREATEASLGRQALTLLETVVENEGLRETVIALDKRVKELEAEVATLRPAAVPETPVDTAVPEGEPSARSPRRRRPA